MKKKIVKHNNQFYIRMDVANGLIPGALAIFQEIQKRGTESPIITSVFYKIAKTKNSLKIHRLLSSLAKAGLITYESTTKGFVIELK